MELKDTEAEQIDELDDVTIDDDLGNDGEDESAIVEGDDEVETDDQNVDQELVDDDAETQEPDAEPEFSVSLGDDESDEPASAPIRAMRKTIRELKKANKDLQAEKETREQVQELGEKPTLEAFDYDAEKFETELLAWNDRKIKSDAAKDAENAEIEKRNARYSERLSGYVARKAELDVADFDDAEALVMETLDKMQQSVIVSHAKDAGVMVLALGRNAKKAQELAEIKDPVEFALAMRDLESKMKVTGMKTKEKPAPERRLSGGTPRPQMGQKKLDALKVQADNSGDYTDYFAAKRALKAKKG